MLGQQFFNEKFQNAVGDTMIDNDLSSQFLIDTGATYSIINCDTFTEIEKTQPLVLMLLKNHLWLQKQTPCPGRGKLLFNLRLTWKVPAIFCKRFMFLTATRHELTFLE